MSTKRRWTVIQGTLVMAAGLGSSACDRGETRVEVDIAASAHAPAVSAEPREEAANENGETRSSPADREEIAIESVEAVVERERDQHLDVDHDGRHVKLESGGHRMALKDEPGKSKVDLRSGDTRIRIGEEGGMKLGGMRL